MHFFQVNTFSSFMQRSCKSCLVHQVWSMCCSLSWRFTWSFHLPCLIIRGGQKHIKSWWALDRRKNLQMKRKTSNDWVKVEPKKMLPERGTSGNLSLARATQLPPCPPACKGQYALGNRGEVLIIQRWPWLTRGNISFVQWHFHLSTQFAPFHTHMYTQTKGTSEACAEDKPRKEGRGRCQRGSVHFLFTDPLCVRLVHSSRHALRMESFLEELIIKTWK